MNKGNFSAIAVCLITTFICIQHRSLGQSDTTFIEGITYASDITWAIEGSPYVISGDVRIENKATLTIEPGVHVLFKPIDMWEGSIQLPPPQFCLFIQFLENPGLGLGDTLIRFFPACDGVCNVCLPADPRRKHEMKAGGKGR